jgi:hypothetical protein
VTGTRNPPRLERHYLSGSSAVTAYEQRPVGRVVAQDGTCALTQLGPNPFPCREWRSPKGRSVFFHASASRYPRRSAFALLEGSLVRVDFEALPETEVLAYFDSLEPVDRDSIEFTRG